MSGKPLDQFKVGEFDRDLLGNIGLKNLEKTVLSVTEFSSQVKRSLEINFDQVCIKGEAVQPKKYPSGTYFTLKEGMCTLDCVVWQNIKIDLEVTEGVELICTGRLTTYPGRSRYQLNVIKIEHSGIGAILKAIEERKKKLSKEGLFDQDKKKPLPKFPKRIGMITSNSGSVLHDMIHRLKDRYPLSVLLFPIPVQGTEMPHKAISAIKYLCQQNVDLIILARGGGSFEDLLGFNDENLVRAVAQSTVPIITAIGHETDTTLVDYASSLRAPTPTAAIELCTPNKNELYNMVESISSKLKIQYKEKYNHLSLILSKIAINDNSFLRFLIQKLEHTRMDLQSAMKLYLMSRKKSPILNLSLNIRQIKNNFAQKIENSVHKKNSALEKFIFLKRNQIQTLREVLTVCNLTPGTCLAKVGEKPILSKKEAIAAEIFSLYFSDGSLKVKIIP